MIIGYFTLAVGAFIFASVIIAGRKRLHHLATASVELLNVMLTQTDEDTHIKNVERATTKLLLALLKSLGLFVLSFIFAALPIASLFFFYENTYYQLEPESFYGILAISIGATLPFFIPKKKKSNQAYSELQQLLHHLVLDNFEIGKKLFKREQKQYATPPSHNVEQFVIVSGLARAGTTSLMNKLAALDTFATLSYANMPLLMAPNLWKKIYNPKTNKTTERSHKDGIQIGLNSNEALEEYFFKTITNNRFIEEKELKVHDLFKEEYQTYLEYQNIIRKNPKQIYLAKNNNCLLRYKSLRALNGVFLMIIMFRDPLTHAMSLLDKHQSFSKLQEDDPFVLNYMNWLGHHEFGLNHIPFDFGTHETLKAYSPDSIDYWLQIWINYYEYALRSKHENTIFICYEHYCDNPSIPISTVFKKLGKPQPTLEVTPFNNPRKKATAFKPELLSNAKSIYDQLIGLA